jgi:CheY-like chemotaxis protein
MGSKRRSLVVEDDPMLTLEIERLLEEGGFIAAGFAANAVSALRVARECKPDWALVDLHLQDGLTGPDIGRRLAHDFGIPVLYVTADAQSAPLDEPGIIGMFPKMYYGADFVEVLAFVQAYLDGRHRQAVAPKYLVRSRC